MKVCIRRTKMKYNHLALILNQAGAYEIEHYAIHGDREERKEYIPYSWGVFYYPEIMTLQEATILLIEDQLKRKNEELQKIKDDIEQLEKLYYATL